MARHRKGDPINGWIFLDKPLNMTSSKAAHEVKKIFNAQKAGHAGTLDPLATGMLPIALGEATKTISFIVTDYKTYQFTVKWGEQTATDDSEGEVIYSTGKTPGQTEINNILPIFIGKISQTPPQYSAIKINGKRAYNLARNGNIFEIKPRNIIIKQLEIIDNAIPGETTFEIICGKGTYIRSIARDMGEKLGCFAHIKALRRLQIGSFCKNKMILLEKLKVLVHSSADSLGRLSCLHRIDVALDDIPAINLNSSEAERIRHGGSIVTNISNIMNTNLNNYSRDLLVAKYNEQPLALMTFNHTINNDQIIIKPKRVINYK